MSITLPWKPLLIFVYHSVTCTVVHVAFVAIVAECGHIDRQTFSLFSCCVVMDLSLLSFGIYHILCAKCRQPCLSFLSEWSQLFPHSIQMSRWWEDLWMACRDAVLHCEVGWFVSKARWFCWTAWERQWYSRHWTSVYFSSVHTALFCYNVSVLYSCPFL